MIVANTVGETLIDAAIGMIGAELESPSAAKASIASR
jgi:hypothetical protein